MVGKESFIHRVASTSPSKERHPAANPEHHHLSSRERGEEQRSQRAGSFIDLHMHRESGRDHKEKVVIISATDDKGKVLNEVKLADGRRAGLYARESTYNWRGEKTGERVKIAGITVYKRGMRDTNSAAVDVLRTGEEHHVRLQTEERIASTPRESQEKHSHRSENARRPEATSAERSSPASSARTQETAKRDEQASPLARKPEKAPPVVTPSAGQPKAAVVPAPEPPLPPPPPASSATTAAPVAPVTTTPTTTTTAPTSPSTDGGRSSRPFEMVQIGPLIADPQTVSDLGAIKTNHPDLYATCELGSETTIDELSRLRAKHPGQYDKLLGALRSGNINNVRKLRYDEEFLHAREEIKRSIERIVTRREETTDS